MTHIYVRDGRILVAPSKTVFIEEHGFSAVTAEIRCSQDKTADFGCVLDAHAKEHGGRLKLLSDAYGKLQVICDMESGSVCLLSRLNSLTLVTLSEDTIDIFNRLNALLNSSVSWSPGDNFKLR